MKATERKNADTKELQSKRPKQTAREIHEDLIDMLVYEERKDGEFVSEEEAMEFLRNHGKI